MSDEALHNTVCDVQIWDVGSFFSQTLTPSFYQKTRAAMIVIDPTDVQAFDRLKYWHQHIIGLADVKGDCFPIVVLANKRSATPSITTLIRTPTSGQDTATTDAFTLPNDLNAGAMDLVELWCTQQERVTLFQLDSLDDTTQLQAAFLHLAAAAAAYTAGKVQVSTCSWRKLLIQALHLIMMT